MAVDEAGGGVVEPAAATSLAPTSPDADWDGCSTNLIRSECPSDSARRGVRKFGDPEPSQQTEGSANAVGRQERGVPARAPPVVLRSSRLA